MKFALIGGDARSAGLAALLAGEGHGVRCYALEKAALPPKFSVGSPEACTYGADWVVLGVPAERSGRLLTPLSVQEVTTQELLTALWPGQTLCGGRIGQATALAGEADFIVNTVPAQVLGRGALEKIRPDAVVLELASEPGFDLALANELGLHALAAPGLPGKTAPLAAAELMRDVIFTAIREREENDGT